MSKREMKGWVEMEEKMRWNNKLSEGEIKKRRVKGVGGNGENEKENK